MENFIAELDYFYAQAKLKDNIKKGNKKYAIYIPIYIGENEKQNTNFLIKKNEFTKYLFIGNGARVYFSDADIISMLLQISNEDIMNELVVGLKNLYRGNGNKYQFFIDDTQYESIGLPPIFNSQILLNPQDIDMDFENVFLLVNMILAKDAAAVPLWGNKYEFMKHTIVKYISLLKYYYFHDILAKDYLNGIGYDIDCSIYENYNTEERRSANNKCFYDFDIFEKSGIL
ncbi:hypothetical protein [Lacrimispora sp.]|uniref:hypothetical protein n=1 Tax=Lacrimispora sp. TaxID=2719234 RepID=UPI0028AC9712|nr:hypothetical protein [Lacrimispora sp.]